MQVLTQGKTKALIKVRSMTAAAPATSRSLTTMQHKRVLLCFKYKTDMLVAHAPHGGTHKGHQRSSANEQHAKALHAQHLVCIPVTCNYWVLEDFASDAT